MTATQKRDASDREGDATSRLRVEVLDALMSKQGIPSVVELARRTEVSRSTIFRLRAHKVNAGTPRVASRLAKVLGTTVDALFEEVG